MAIENHDQVILLGDLNFRLVDLTRNTILAKIEANDLRPLLNRDALTLARFSHKKKHTKSNHELRHQRNAVFLAR